MARSFIDGVADGMLENQVRRAESAANAALDDAERARREAGDAARGKIQLLDEIRDLRAQVKIADVGDLTLFRALRATYAKLDPSTQVQISQQLNEDLKEQMPIMQKEMGISLKDLTAAMRKRAPNTIADLGLRV